MAFQSPAQKYEEKQLNLGDMQRIDTELCL
ncbi:hypothetical protein J2X14_000423 [Pantoea alhagi]|nr:hypothetical protein [Pantoea alhagi]